MRQFHKGRRLLLICEQKIRTVQISIATTMARRDQLIETIKQLEEQMRSIEKSLHSQQLTAVEVTKAEIFIQRRQQVLLLHLSQQLAVERVVQFEELDKVNIALAQLHSQLAYLKRREMKFTEWTHRSKREWMMQQDTKTENEQQDDVPWRFGPT